MMACYTATATCNDSKNDLGICTCTIYINLHIQCVPIEWRQNSNPFKYDITQTCVILTTLFSIYLHTHTHTFNGPLSGTTQVSLHQKGKTNLDFTEARDSEWQWHQLGHMQACNTLQTNNHASTPPLVFYRPDALPAALKHLNNI